jgi:hypothetical protein
MNAIGKHMDFGRTQIRRYEDSVGAEGIEKED